MSALPAPGTYRVAIRCNATGEVRMCDHEGSYLDLYWWTDGNFGCDCNRYLEFGRAGGEIGNSPTKAQWAAAVCGETRYSALYAEMPDGTKIEIDTGGLKP